MLIAPLVLFAASLQPPRPAAAPLRLHEYTVDAGHSPVEFSIGFGLTHVKGRFTHWRGTAARPAAVDAALQRVATEGVGAQVQRVRDPNEQFPQDDPTWYYLDAFVRILLEAGQVPQAVELSRVTAELYPDVARAHSRYGEALALAGRRDAAGEAFARALQRDPMESRAMAYRRALLP